jgi:transcriptional regulator with XRE-family HTH domain
LSIILIFSSVLLRGHLKQYAEMFEKQINVRLQNISRRIGEIRASKGLTQAKLAEKLDRSLDMVQVWERGRGITVRTLLLLAMVLDSTVEEFFKEPKTPKPSAGRPIKQKVKFKKR